MIDNKEERKARDMPCIYLVSKSAIEPFNSQDAKQGTLHCICNL